MNRIGKFLNSIYRDETITSIVEEAMNGSYQLHIIDNRTGTTYPLKVGQLALIRKKHPKEASIQLQEPIMEQIGSYQRIARFHYDQCVSYIDLRIDEKNLSLIEVIFGNSDKYSPVIATQAETLEQQTNEVKLTEEEINSEYYKNPADSDPRLREDAIEMLISNPKMKLNEIHENLIEQEKGKSDISIHVLKHIVQYDDIKREAKKRIDAKSKSEQVR